MLDAWFGSYPAAHASDLRARFQSDDDQLDAACDAALRSIYSALGGDETLLVRKRSGSDPRLDFVLADHALAVEVDEIQHFTTERLRTLDLYPPDAALCFDTRDESALADVMYWCSRARASP